MLNDLAACEEVTWDRLLEYVGETVLDQELKAARFISAVNWGKLSHAGPIWSNLAARLANLGVPAKQVIYFMDLAEFESRPATDREDLISRLPAITRQCNTIMSLNLKEAWQLAEVFGGAFQGRKEAMDVAELAAFLYSRIERGPRECPSQWRGCVRRGQWYRLCAGALLPRTAHLYRGWR